MRILLVGHGKRGRLVESLGVHLLQGYLFGRPSPLPASGALVQPLAPE